MEKKDIEVEIDPGAGFCFGVTCAIQQAEKALNEGLTIYTLGDIVHNSIEIERLQSRGLEAIDHEQYKKMQNTTVLLRAHGEPPETYRTAHENNIRLIDATCPVVLRLQNRIKEGYQQMKEAGGQVIIYGKKGHAEVIGLEGQAHMEAIVISSIDDIEKIDFSRPVILFSQTTMQGDKFDEIWKEIEKRMVNKDSFEAHNTICKKVANRIPNLKEFARNKDLVIFVSSEKSSNGKMLYQICREENLNTYFVTDEADIRQEWFHNGSIVGISGATSTPQWILEKVARQIKSFNQ